MSWQPTRNFHGYGEKPIDPKWPNGARLAVNFVMNYEEGSEPSVQDGEGYTETGLTESTTSQVGMNGRDLAAEGMFEYGSRVGFWRLMRAFQERGLPMTVFGCALALERNPAAAAGSHDYAEHHAVAGTRPHAGLGEGEAVGVVTHLGCAPQEPLEVRLEGAVDQAD